MEYHLKLVGRLNIAYAILAGLPAIVALIAANGVMGVYQFFDDVTFAVVAATATLLHALLAAPCLVGGIYVLRYRNWARVLLIVASALNCLVFPLGTMLGAYTLWALLTPEIEPLFTDTPRSLLGRR
ncbi:MAG TPA: hypothetical protein VFL57_12860 [Bryobacteraceae bacterium]|nr:hypothetical protein [Bryobacteraceae bacterium]